MPKVGSDVNGTVTRTEHYGTYFDVSGVEVLVLLPELSWTVPAPELTVGDCHTIKLIRRTPSGFCGSLRRLDVEGNPYLSIAKMPSDTKHKAKVFSNIDSIVMAELAEGAWGPVSGKSVVNLSVGEEILVRVRVLDAEEGKAELQLCEPDDG